MVTIPRDRALAVVTAAGAAGYWLFARRALRLGAVRLAAGGALLAALAAIVAFAAFVGAALAPLAGLSFGVGGTLGIMLMVTAMLLCLVISVSPAPAAASESGARTRRKTAGQSERPVALSDRVPSRVMTAGTQSSVGPVALVAAALVALGTGTARPAAGQVARLDGTEIPTDRLTEGIEDLVRRADVHGLTVTVFNHGDAVYSRAFGHADRPTGRPLATDTELYGASLSKAVFGVLVMRLVEKGVIDLDTPLQDYLDEPLWRNEGTEWHEDQSALRDDPRYRKITARMALSHTTGMPNWRWFEPDQKLRIHFEPGERYQYSGEGMVFLQIALQNITGKPLEELMREEVFGPYGMDVSSYTWQPRFEADYALGHRSDGSTYPRDKDNAARAPSTLETTTDDYVRFMEAVLRGDGLSAASWEEMFRPQIRIRTRTQFGPGASEETDANDDIELSYGLGWGLLRTPYGWGAFKEGKGDGFQHYSIVFPESGIGVLLMGCSDNADSIFDHLLRLTIADAYTPLEWEGYVPFDR